MAALHEHGYGPIDLVAVNLYPFRETVASGNVSVEVAMEKVDIGGPTMIRAAAKSHKDVWVVVDPTDYGDVIDAIDGKEGPGFRRRLAAKVFQHVSDYDSAVASYLLDRSVEERSGEILGEHLKTSLSRLNLLHPQ